MSIFSSKDWNANKSDKIRHAVGVERGLGHDATDQEVSDAIDDHLRRLVKRVESNEAAAAVPEI